MPRVLRLTEAQLLAIAPTVVRSPAVVDMDAGAAPRVPGVESGIRAAWAAQSGNDTAVQGAYLMLPYPVPLNRAYRNFRGRMVMSVEARAWKHNAAIVARTYGMALIESGPVAVSLILHPRMNKDGSATKTRIDLDSCLKVALDAMNGVAYTDDKQINKLSALIGDPVEGGGLSVRVAAL